MNNILWKTKQRLCTANFLVA